MTEQEYLELKLRMLKIKRSLDKMVKHNKEVLEYAHHYSHSANDRIS